MTKKQTYKYKKYIPCCASLADIAIIANEMSKVDKSVTLNKEILEYILINNFGFDKEYNEFTHTDDNGGKVFNWYEVENILHRPTLSNTPVKCDRYTGAERLDAEWHSTGLMSDQAWNVFRGV